MAGSRKRPPNPDRFEAALDEALEGAFVGRGGDLQEGLGIAFSGGADSLLLLETGAAVAKRRNIRAVALHVHHGLSPHAGDWAEFCRKVSQDLGLGFHLARVTIEQRGGDSLEASARDARYAALETLCTALRLGALVTGHHAKDQAETVLLNLCRGAGVAGLQGIAAARPLGGALLVRPFLSFSAEEIREALSERGRCWIEDESNRDESLRRNAIRRRILPALDEIVPGALGHLSRMAELASQAQVLLDERGSEDLIRLMADDSGFAIAPFLQLSRERAINALRTWFRQYRGQAPSEAFTLSLIDQIKVDQPSSRTELLHGEERFVVRQGRLVAAPVRARAKRPAPQSLSWSGQTTVELPEWGGRIRFDAESSCGLSAAWLRTVTLTVRARAGGERLRLARGRPSRTLKNLYQESGIPPEERRHLPLLYVGDSLLWAAGLGADVATAPSDERPGVTLVWESTTASR